MNKAGTCNRQLAKLLSGNEVRGKVAIAAVQMTVNFTRSLSRWPRKVFWAHFSPDLGRFQRSRCICRASASSRRIFFGEEGRPFWQKRRCMARKGEALIKLGLSCFAVQQFIARLKVCVSFYFLIFQRNSSLTKTLMQQRQKGPGRCHSCAVLPVWHAVQGAFQSVGHQNQQCSLVTFAVQPCTRKQKHFFHREKPCFEN